MQTKSRLARIGAEITLTLTLVSGVAPAPASQEPTSDPAAQNDGPTIQFAIDAPAQDAQISGPVVIRGWAADPLAAVGTGIERVEVYLDGESANGGATLSDPTGQLVGEARYGDSRPDVGAALGGPNAIAQAQFTPSGFSLLWNPVDVAPGPHTITVYAVGPSGAVARSLTLHLALPTAGGSAMPPLPHEVAERFPVTIEAVTPTTVTLHWVPVPGSVVYEVYAWTNPGQVSVDHRRVFSTDATVRGLMGGRSYVIQVVALSAGQSRTAVASSLPTGVTTPPAPTVTLYVPPSPQPTATPRPTNTRPPTFTPAPTR